jgi:hypothetical protein
LATEEKAVTIRASRPAGCGVRLEFFFNYLVDLSEIRYKLEKLLRHPSPGVRGHKRKGYV